MRHHIVTRIVLSLVVLFVAAVALFAWGVTRHVASRAEVPVEPAAATAELLFSSHCATCHDAADVGIAYREAEDRDAALTALREFLAEHHGPSPEGIVLIVDHVMAQ